MSVPLSSRGSKGNHNGRGSEWESPREERYADFIGSSMKPGISAVKLY